MRRSALWSARMWCLARGTRPAGSGNRTLSGSVTQWVTRGLTGSVMSVPDAGSWRMWDIQAQELSNTVCITACWTEQG